MTECSSENEELESIDPSSQLTAIESLTEPMDWEEWEKWLRKIQSKGLERFLRKYVNSEQLNINKFMINLELTISMIEPNLEDEQENMEAQLKQQERLDTFKLIKRAIIRFLKRRKRLEQYQTTDDVIELIKTRQKIMIITGAGISTSCGIPDFRSSDGLYSQFKDLEELDDPYDMFDLRFFKSNPKIFYTFAKQIFPFSSTSNEDSNKSNLNFIPSIINPSDSHRFLRLIESKSKLLRNYTQNIDTLEMRAGVKNLIQCHGSFATFTCLKCEKKFPCETFEQQISKSEIILCPICTSIPDSKLSPPQKSLNDNNHHLNKKRKLNNDHQGFGSDDDEEEEEVDWVSKGLVKPDIIFFGEGLSEEFHQSFDSDRLQTDLLIVIGTSLAVSPVSELMHHIPKEIPQILINRDPIVNYTTNFDICLLGESDRIIRYLIKKLGSEWQFNSQELQKKNHSNNNNNNNNNDNDKGINGNVNDLNQDVKENDDLNEDQENKVDLINEKEEEEEEEEEPKRIGTSHVWLFHGSNFNHPWLKQWSELDSDSTDSEDL